MIVIKPELIDSTSLLSTTIAEPDLTVGEVEWEDPLVLTEFGETLIDYRTSTSAGDGNVYCTTANIGVPSNVLKIDVDTQSVTTIGSFPGGYTAAALANDGDIYCAGSAGDILKISVSGQSVSFFGSTTGVYLTATLAGDGNIYCVGAAGDVLKINVALQTVSTFGVHASQYNSSAIAADGNIYCVGAAGDVLKIDVALQAVSTFGAHTGAYNAAVNGGAAGGGNIYCVGQLTNKIMKINIEDQTVSFFGIVKSTQQAATLAGDGNIYCFGTTGDVLKIDVALETTSVFGSNERYIRTSALAGDGNIYCVGTIIDVGDIVRLKTPYLSGDEVIVVDSHAIYQAASATVDYPPTGALKTPPTWVKTGPTNRFAMFDDKIGSESIVTTPLEVEVTSTGIINGVAGFGVSGVTGINVTVTDDIDGEVYNTDVPMLSSIPIANLYNYFFEPLQYKPNFVLLDLPPYTNATVKITYTGAAEIKVGATVAGRQASIGETIYGSSVQLLDFSRKQRDIFGNFEIVKGRTAKLVNFDMKIATGQVSYVFSQLQQLSQVASVWVGSDDTSNTATLIYGIYKDFTDNISTPTITDSTIIVEGLI